VAYLRRRGIDTLLRYPGSAAETTAEAREAAARGDALVFALGGDGSQRDCAAGVAGSSTALAPIPMGTVNIFARELGIPRGLRSALDAHIGGHTAQMDLGRAGGQLFLLMASIGWDAAIVRGVSHPLKRRLGDIAYMLKAAQELPWLRPRRMRWRTATTASEDDVAIMVFSNTRLYGGRVYFSREAYADDGLLDCVALCPHSIADGARLSARLVLSRLGGDPRVHAFRAEAVDVDTPGLPVQLDGDYVGDTPMRFGVERLALRVSIPAGPRPAILGAAE
jgi:YegS/Rv2252/BmrU family lipid kinase